MTAAICSRCSEPLVEPPADGLCVELEEAEGQLFDRSVPVAANSAYNPDNEFA